MPKDRRCPGDYIGHSRNHWRLGTEAELATAEVRPEGVEPLIGAIRASLDELNAIRTQLLPTVGANAG